MSHPHTVELFDVVNQPRQGIPLGEREIYIDIQPAVDLSDAFADYLKTGSLDGTKETVVDEDKLTIAQLAGIAPRPNDPIEEVRQLGNGDGTRTRIYARHSQPGNDEDPNIIRKEALVDLEIRTLRYLGGLGVEASIKGDFKIPRILEKMAIEG